MFLRSSYVVSLPRLVFVILVTAVVLAGQTLTTAQSVYQEAPMLAELVRAGKLPPVDERMPANPVLIKPVEEVGQYGGTWRMAKVLGDTGIIWRTVMYEGLVRWNPQWTSVIPNLAQTVEASPDATTYTFKLRKGVRWSDGAPFTADDIMFWYNDVFLNPELGPSHTLFLTPMQTKFVVEKIDDYTVVFRFTEPFGLFLQQMAIIESTKINWYPKHFLQQYHAAYNPNIAYLVRKEGVANWVELFNKHRSGTVKIINPGTPVLDAWIFSAETVISATPGDVFYAVRNPYYWKIDTEFNQLPYLDRVEFKVVKTPQQATDLALQGDIDFQDRFIIVSQVLSSEKYKVVQLVESQANRFAIFFNQTVDDPIKQQIFQNRDFRVGLSHGLNRPALVQALGSPFEISQAAPVQITPFYDVEFSMQYLNYDVALANEYLDKAGLQRDAEGKRLGPDGKPFGFTLLLPDPFVGEKAEIYLMQVQQDWQALGLTVEIERVSRAEADARITASSESFNKFDVFLWPADGGYDVILNPRIYLPIQDHEGHRYAPRWALWNSDPTHPKAATPPDYIQAQMALYKQILATPDQDRQNELMKEVLKTSKEQFYVIGTVRSTSLYGIRRANFYNVPTLMPSAAIYANPAPTNPCQYFIK